MIASGVGLGVEHCSGAGSGEMPARSRDESSAGGKFGSRKPGSRKLRERRILAATQGSAWLSLWTAVPGAGLLAIFLFPGTAGAAKLKPETRQAWEEYVVAADARMQEHLSSDHPFLLSDEDPDRAAKLRKGEILVSPAGPHIPKRVPSGLIHDWTGEAFISNATLHDVLPVVRNYGCYKKVYKPSVVDSRAIATGETEDQFFMLLMNKSVISKTALDSDFRSSYVRVNDQHWYSVSESVRIQEVAGYGTGEEHMLPADEGTGLIWRTYSIARFEERDGGVYMELEAMVLSRDIPLVLRDIVNPIVRRVSRDSLITSLHQTQEAVRSAAKVGDCYVASGR